jgi:hypothetical protein
VVDVGLGPPLVGGIARPACGIDDRDEVEIDQPGRAPQIVEVAAEAGRDDRVAVGGGVEGPESPSLAPAERDEAVGPAVQSPDIGVGDRSGDQPDGRRVRVVTQ